MKILPPTVTAACLAALLVSTAPLAAQAAPTPGKFAGTAGGSIADGDFNAKGGGGLANVNFLVSGAKVSSTATPKAVSGSSAVVAGALGRQVPYGVNLRTAGPTSGSTTSNTPGVSQRGVTVNAVTSTNTANFTSTTGCNAATIAESVTKSSGVDIAPATFGRAAKWATSSTSGQVALTTVDGSDNRAVVSKATGEIGDISILDNRFVLKVEGSSTLTASATGEAGGANAVYSPAKITLTSPARGEDSELVRIRPGDVAVKRNVTIRGKTATVTFKANAPTLETSDNGQQATAKASLLTMTVEAQPGDIEGDGTLNLLPLQAIATAPAGGVICPAGAAPADPDPVTDDPAPPNNAAPPVNGQQPNLPGNSLASTGGPNGIVLLLGGLLLAAGAVLVPYSIRRRRHG